MTGEEIPERETLFSHFGIVSGFEELQILLQCALPKYLKNNEGGNMHAKSSKNWLTFAVAHCIERRPE